MKNKITVIILTATLLLALLAYGVMGENAGDVTNDPLITLSYLNEDYWQRIEDAISSALGKGSGDTSADDTSADDTSNSQTEENTSSDTVDTSDVPETAVTDKSFSYEVLHLFEGDTVLAETPCEIILRSGSAVAYLSGNSSGISDLTSGIDLKEGESLEANHLLLVPRGGDGRGFKVTSSEAYIMVRGGYGFAEAESEAAE